MNITSQPNEYVSLVLDNKIVIDNVSEEMIPRLMTLGAKIQNSESKNEWSIDVDWFNDKLLGEMLGNLRDIGVRFVDEPSGWPPAAVFRELRSAGYVSGRFTSITWSGPGEWRTIEN